MDPYKWTPTSGSLMYCMPKVGTKASLYFSSADKRSGIATNSPRINRGSDSQSEVTTKGFDNVQNRGMVTEHGKRMDLYPELMRFSATGEVDGETGEIIKPLELLFDDETGIIAESILDPAKDYAKNQSEFEGLFKEAKRMINTILNRSED